MPQRTTSLVARLAKAQIGTTVNLYRSGCETAFRQGLIESLGV